MRRHILDYAAQNVPRYTSYPTAPHFTAEIGAADYIAWLEEIPSSATFSLYLHIPFCRAICHYCGCHTKAALREEPIRAYAATLRRELNGLVGAWHHRTGKPHGVIHTELRKACGGPPAAMATTEELRNRIDTIRGWAAARQ
jgi:coproporphyrinogen III oxidase-like Fe-S oxidoreductase